MKDILLVDHDELTLAVLEAMINVRFRDVRVRTASNAQAALDVLASMPVDFVLTDLQMLAGDGHVLAEYCKRHYPCIPLLAIVQNPSEATEARLRELDVQQWIARPFDINEVADRIAKEMQPESWAAAGRIKKHPPIGRHIPSRPDIYIPRGKTTA